MNASSNNKVDDKSRRLFLFHSYPDGLTFFCLDSNLFTLERCRRVINENV